MMYFLYQTPEDYLDFLWFWYLYWYLFSTFNKRQTMYLFEGCLSISCTYSASILKLLTLGKQVLPMHLTLGMPASVMCPCCSCYWFAFYDHWLKAIAQVLNYDWVNTYGILTLGLQCYCCFTSSRPLNSVTFCLPLLRLAIFFRATKACRNGRRTVITLRCDTKDASKDGALSLPSHCPDGTCDGCNFLFLWTSAHACPRCSEDDYSEFKEMCINGKQRVIKKPTKWGAGLFHSRREVF